MKKEIKMKRVVFKSLSDFIKNSEYSENGCTQEFLNRYYKGDEEKFKEDNKTNKNCFNCKGCRNLGSL